MRRVSGLMCGLCLLTSGMAFGQVVQETQPVPVPAAAPAVAAPQINRVSQLIGSNVQLQGMPNYGKIEDVVLDNNGRIDYLVVANNGRYAMLPWTAATVNYPRRIVSYSVTPQAIQPLFFPMNAWPNISDQVWTTRMRGVFPNAGVVRREVLRPVEGTVPLAPGVVAPAPGAVKEKVKVKPNGNVKIKDKIE